MKRTGFSRIIAKKGRFVAAFLTMCALIVPGMAFATNQVNDAQTVGRPYNGTDTVEVVNMHFSDAVPSDYERLSATATGYLPSPDAGHYDKLVKVSNVTLKERTPDMFPSDPVNWSDWYSIPSELTGNIGADVTITKAKPEVVVSTSVSSGKNESEVKVTATISNSFGREEGLPTAAQVEFSATNATQDGGVTRSGNAYTATFKLVGSTEDREAVFSFNVTGDAKNYQRLDTPAKSAPVTVERMYKLSVVTDGEGDVTVSPQTPNAGDTVRIELAPKDGWGVKSVAVTDPSGGEVKTEQLDYDVYTFVQPKDDLQVKAVFFKLRTDVEAADRPYDGTDVVEVTNMHFSAAVAKDYDRLSATAKGYLPSPDAGHYDHVVKLTDIKPKDRHPVEGERPIYYWYSLPTEAVATLPTDVTITKAKPELSLAFSKDSEEGGKEIEVTVTLANDYDREEGLPNAEQIDLKAVNATLKEGSVLTRSGKEYKATYVLTDDPKNLKAEFSVNVKDDAVNYAHLDKPVTGTVEVLFPADYTKVNEAIAQAKALDRSKYVDLASVDEAVKNVVFGLYSKDQAKVDGYAAAIEAAIANLQLKPTYKPEVVKPAGGEVSVDNENPKEGDTVTVTVKPGKGKAIEKITVVDENGKEVPVKEVKPGVYTYVQPKGKVKITVSFKDLPKPPSPGTGAWDGIYTENEYATGNAGTVVKVVGGSALPKTADASSAGLALAAVAGSAIVVAAATSRIRRKRDCR